MQRAILTLFACALLAAVPPATAVADTPWVSVFRDDFNGQQLDLSSWRVISPNGAIALTSGLLELRSGGNGFPSLATIDGIVPPLGNFKLRYGFQYGRTTCFGTRIGAVAFGVGGPCAYDPSFDPAYYGFKRDCAGSNVSAFPSGLISACGYVAQGFGDGPTFHVGEIVYTNGSVTVILDGVEIASAPGPVPRPSAIFLGWGTEGYDYTEYDLDFVEVQTPGGVTRSRPSSWGHLKSYYR